MTKYVLSILVCGMFLFLMAFPTNAQKLKRTGSAGFTFLELPATARQAAMGEAYSALGGITDASSIFINPAALGYVTGPTISLSYGTWLVETNHQTAAFAYGMGSAGSFGISFIRFDGGDIQGAVADATLMEGYRKTGNYNFGSYAIGPSYGYRMTDRFSFGATVRYVQEGISNVSGVASGSSFNAQNFLAEVGTLYYTGFGSLRFATNVQSIGFDSQYEADAFQSPLVYRIGAAYDFFDTPDSPAKLTTVVEAIHPTDATERVMLGGELWVKNMIALRGGYKFGFDEEGVTAGVGLKFDMGGGRPIGVDFAYVDYGRFDSITRFSLNFGM